MASDCWHCFNRVDPWSCWEGGCGVNAWLDGVLLAVQVTTAAVTAWMAVSTQRMAKATKENQETQEKTIERMKDAQMPVLMIEVGVEVETEKNGLEIVITVVNQGSGAAFVKDISTRSEINGGSLYYCPLRNALIGVGQTVTERTPVDGRHTIPTHFEVVSSISLWYADVYGRWYRSRVIFKYPQNNEVKEMHATKVLFREYFPHIPARSFVHDLWAAEDNIHDCEMGSMVPFNFEPAILWKVGSIAPVTKDEYPGNELTQYRPIRIRNYSFWVNAYPLFRVQVGSYPAWLIGQRDGSGPGGRETFLGEEALLQSRFVGMIVTSSRLSEPAKYGLKDTQYINALGSALYQSLLTEALKRAEG